MAWESRETRDKREVAEREALGSLIDQVIKTVVEARTTDIVQVQVEPSAYDKTRFSYYLWFAPVPVEEGGEGGEGQTKGESVEIWFGRLGVNAMVRIGARFGRDKVQVGVKKATVAWVIETARERIRLERERRVREAASRASHLDATDQAEAALGFKIGYNYGSEKTGYNRFSSDINASLNSDGKLLLGFRVGRGDFSPDQVLRIIAILEEGK